MQCVHAVMYKSDDKWLAYVLRVISAVVFLDIAIMFRVLSMMSQNKMAAVVWGLCTGRYWAR